MAASTPSGSPAPHRITVNYKNGEISVTPASVIVDKTKREHIQWNAAGDFNFNVSFANGGPFSSGHFDRKNNASGQARPEASGLYKYSVQIDDKVLDPDVIIRP